MPSSLRIVGALTAPLLVAGCGLPVGIQIASLFADGISVLTTDKTLTDHGISAVTDKDCALWRSVEGKDICTDPAGPGTAIADAGATGASQADLEESPEESLGEIPEENLEQSWGETAAAETEDKKDARRETPEFPAEDSVETASAPTLPVQPVAVTSEPLETPRPWKAVAVVDDLPPVPPAPPAEPEAVATPAPAPPPAVKPVRKAPVKRAQPRSRKTYYIIASYHRAADAERFSRRHAKLEPAVLKGTAKGKRVFRVAIGPVAKSERRSVRTSLKRQGFKDTWALTLKSAPPATEVASLN